MTPLGTVATGPKGPRLHACDRRCDKAWGVNGRRPENGNSRLLGDDPNDVVWLPDREVGIAPADPGTYEAGEAKPDRPEIHGKWCVRECERCSSADAGQRIAVWDFSKPIHNQPRKHPEADQDPVHAFGAFDPVSPPPWAKDLTGR